MPTAYLTDRALVSVVRAGCGAFPAERHHHRPRRACAGRGETGRAADAAGQDPVRFPGLARRRRRLPARMPRRHRRRSRAPADALQAARQGEITKRDQKLVRVAWRSRFRRFAILTRPPPGIGCATGAFAEPAGSGATIRRTARRRRTNPPPGSASASPSALPKAASTMRSAMPFRMTCCWTRSAASASRRAAMSARKSCRACSIAAPRGGAC